MAIGALLLLTGCAHAGATTKTAPTTTPPPPPSSTASLVLRVADTGGFMGPGWWQAELPLLSVYSDGRAISEGPVPAVYPGPALPRLFVKRLDAAALQDMVDAALAAGVAETTDLGRPPVADAVTTRFTVVAGSHRYVREVYALGADPAGLSPEQQAARAKLQALQQRLSRAALRSGLEEPYSVQSVAVLASPWTEPQNRLDRPPAPWPGPPLPGEPMRTRPGTGCGTATGSRAQAVLAAAAGASELTPWVTPDGVHWHVGFRPLLPDETGCADLAG